MRFSPPSVALPAELIWLLGAAFGPRLPKRPEDPAAVPDLARRFDLGPRIVARHGAERLAGRLGSAAGELIRAHRRAVALGMAGERTALKVARLAQSRGLTMVLLKGCALQRLAPGPPGWRPFVDLDVLLDRRQAAQLRETLMADGWAAAAEPGNPQHLPPVQDPEGVPVDIHFRLRGVRVGAERWASAAELLAADLCLPAGLGDGCWVPQPLLMAAHLATHALEQHGLRPGTYPLLRAVADLVDIDSAAGPLPEARVGDLVGDELETEEVAALFSLSRTLAEGRLPDNGDEASGAVTLLRHIVAGALEPQYRRGLTITHTAGRLRQAHRDGELIRYVLRKLRPPAESSDVAAGASTRDQGFFRKRILRPLQLAARFTSAAVARLRRVFDR